MIQNMSAGYNVFAISCVDQSDVQRTRGTLAFSQDLATIKLRERPEKKAIELKVRDRWLLTPRAFAVGHG